MQRIFDFFKKHTAFFAVSFLLPVYHFIVVNRAEIFTVSEKSFSFHTVDYSMGFCSRFFPGEVYHLLVGVYTKKAVDIYLSCLYVFFILLLAFLLDRFSVRFRDYRKECFVLIFLFLAGPFTFNMIVLQFGLLDFYYVFAFFVSLLFLHNKVLRFAVPVLSAVMIAINYETLFSYVMLLLVILLFYSISECDKIEKKIRFSLFFITLVISVSLSLYFLINDKGNLTLSAIGFERLMQSRNANPDYYELFFYNRLPNGANLPGVVGTEQISGGFSGLKNAFAFLLSLLKNASVSRENLELLFFGVFALIPQSVLIFILACYSKNSENRFKKAFVWIFVLFIFAFEIMGLLITSTNIRSLMHAVIMLFVFTMYLIINEYPEGLVKLGGLFKRVGWWLLSIIMFFYTFMVLNPSTLH